MINMNTSFDKLNRISTPYLTSIHLEIFENLNITICSLETQSPKAWKALLEAGDVNLISIDAFATRQRRHDFYYRHEKAVTTLLNAYPDKIPFHLRHSLKIHYNVNSKLLGKAIKRTA